MVFWQLWGIIVYKWKVLIELASRQKKSQMIHIWIAQQMQTLKIFKAIEENYELIEKNEYLKKLKLIVIR